MKLSDAVVGVIWAITMAFIGIACWEIGQYIGHHVRWRKRSNNVQLID